MADAEGKRAEKIAGYAEKGDVNIGRVYVDQREERAQLNGIPQNLPMRGATKFVGRGAELETLHREMQNHDRVTISAIAGMGGIGKTELALQYAIRHAASYPGGICWLNGTRGDFFEQMLEFVRLVLLLKLPPELEKTLTTPEQQFDWYREHWQPSGAVLLIVDDVAEMGALRSFLPHLPSRFRVLLTTRRRSLDAYFVELPLDVLSTQEAIELLAKLIGTQRVEAERATAAALCESLGWLPLGLELLGRYVAPKQFLSLSELKAQLQLQHQALLERDPNYVMTAQEGVRAAFELSWKELGDPAMTMGQFLSLFTAAAIPWSLVQRVTEALGWEPETMEEAREQLANRHLLQDVTRQEFRLHPLMREFFALKLNELDNREELRSTYIKALLDVAAAIPYEMTLAHVAQFSSAMPHLKALAESDLRVVPDERLADLLNGLANFYQGQGAYAIAEPWLKQGVEVMRDRLGEDHPSYLVTLHNLAVLYQAQGRYGAAEPLYLQVRDTRKQVLGEDHPSYLTTLHNLASLYEAQGRYGAAEPLYLQVRDTQKQVLGEDHPSYLTTLNNLAGLYQAQGRYGAAEPLYLQVRDTRKQVLGEDHPSYLTTLNNLASLYEAQGRYRAAEPLYLQVRDTQKQVLGEDHPSYLTTLNNLAGLYEAQGRYREAEPLYLQVRDIEKQVLGEDHPSYLTTLNNLAGLYFSQANVLKFPQATLLLVQALKIKARVLGWKHPSTRITITNLAQFLLLEIFGGWALLSLALVFLQQPNWFSLLRLVGYLVFMWLLLRETFTARVGQFFRRIGASRHQKRR